VEFEGDREWRRPRQHREVVAGRRTRWSLGDCPGDGESDSSAPAGRKPGELQSLSDRWLQLNSASWTAGYGPVRPVVWGGGGGLAPRPLLDPPRRLSVGRL